MTYKRPNIIELDDIYAHTTPLFRFRINHDGTSVVLGNYMTVRFIGKPFIDSNNTMWDASCLVTDSTNGVCQCRLSLLDTTNSIHGMYAELRVEDHILQTSDVVGQYKFDILASLGG